jgi:hypothetical protein
MLLLIRTVGGHPLQKHQNFLVTACALVVSLVPESLGLQDKREGRQHRVRTRKFVNEIFKELGPYYVRRAYRMEGTSFWKLCRLLRPFVVKASTKKCRNGAKNGLIPSPTKISVALRYFAGGSPYDIAVVHGISHTEVFRSLWTVVDAVNACPDLAFEYPKDHSEQQKLRMASSPIAVASLVAVLELSMGSLFGWRSRVTNIVPCQSVDQRSSFVVGRRSSVSTCKRHVITTRSSWILI